MRLGESVSLFIIFFFYISDNQLIVISPLHSSGFTPLILAATAGHVGVVEVLLDKGGDIEAQSERTKDTPLSLACSGGRQEVNTPYLILP